MINHENLDRLPTSFESEAKLICLADVDSGRLEAPLVRRGPLDVLYDDDLCLPLRRLEF